MLSSGRQANHLYLQVVGDGDLHDLVHAHAVLLPTAVDRLERILSHDNTAASASTQLRDQHDPARLLAPALARYTDALGVAAEQVVGADVGQRLDQEADNLVLWLTECPAWDTLRADLLGLAADGHDPVRLLRETVSVGELDTARDPAAVLDHRLHLLVPDQAPGPLPWLRGVPSRGARDEVWGPYLQPRADRVEGLAGALRREVRSHPRPPDWLGPMSLTPRMFENGVLLGDVAVWRAVMDVPASDLRLTGASPSTGEWGRLLPGLDPALARDPEGPFIAHRLHALEENGVDVRQVGRERACRGTTAGRAPCLGAVVARRRHCQGLAGLAVSPRDRGGVGDRHTAARPSARTRTRARLRPRPRRPLHRLLNTHHNEGETMSVIESTKPGAFVSLAQAADILGISVHTLRRRIATASCPPSALGAGSLGFGSATLKGCCVACLRLETGEPSRGSGLSRAAIKKGSWSVALVAAPSVSTGYPALVADIGIELVTRASLPSAVHPIQCLRARCCQTSSRSF
jgi:hypothetical protein